jgi:hypothetical protein
MPADNTRSPATDFEVATVLARSREGLVPAYDFVAMYSRQHIALVDSKHTLCGARIRWLYISPGDGRRCQRCFALARTRNYRNENGYPLLDPDFDYDA